MPYLSQNYIGILFLASCAHGIQDEYLEDQINNRNLVEHSKTSIKEITCFEERRDIVQRCTLIVLNCNENKEFLLQCPIEYPSFDLEQVAEPYENKR